MNREKSVRMRHISQITFLLTYNVGFLVLFDRCVTSSFKHRDKIPRIFSSLTLKVPTSESIYGRRFAYSKLAYYLIIAQNLILVKRKKQSYGWMVFLGLECG